MKKYIVLLVSLFLVAQSVIAQNEKDRAYILKHTNVKALNEIAERSRSHYEDSANKLENLSVKSEIVNSKNQKGYLSGFDQEGNPVYDFDDNVDVANSSRINRIWVDGSSGLNLDGSGIQIGQWEAGGVPLTSHKELNGNVSHGEVATVSSHSTHTSCTMVGEGLVAKSRGMASSATVVSRRSNNDESEIANFAAAGGILSNHSYSSGNPDGNVTEYGQYTANSKEWDDILYNAPYLTICKSASNDRDDGVNSADFGYDLVYTIATCKNLLTIGAVDDVDQYSGPQSVSQSVFSSWGPSDDWRIKPDLTANGVSVFSADNDNNNDYTLKSGTSMSTPAVTGTIALLQQHYHNIYGVYMRAATVKALLLGTTDEAGLNDGPDFQSGWGLMNAERAAEVITNNEATSLIDELTLSNGSTYTTTIETDGSSPLALTIAWTDPSGPVLFGTDNKTPRLVNDLDVRISNNEMTYEPWFLTPNAASNNFLTAAAKGDNFRDNVERIDISDLPADIYTITVSHKGNLINGTQNFSMIVNGIQEESLSSEEIEDQRNSILIYPNPSEDGFFNMKVSNDVQFENYSVNVYDVFGRLVQSKNYKEHQVNLDLTEMNSGLYIIKIRIDNVDVVRYVSIQ